MFPLGITPYLVGGLIVGIGVSLIFCLTGLHATQSSFFTTTLSWFSKRAHFQRQNNLEERDWRLVLALGLATGGLIETLLISKTGLFTTSVSVIRLVIGGFLVGVGTRLSGGCTSGHGISGLASLSTTSMYAVITFMVVGMVTANLTRLLGLPL